MSFWKNRFVLVTGGAGFIGSHLVTALVECGANVSVVDNLERGRKEVLGDVLDHVKFFDRDLRESGVASGLCDGMDAVIHLAAKVGGIDYYTRRTHEVLETNVLIDGNVLHGVLRRRVPRYFYASSAHVYPAALQTGAVTPPIKEHQALPADPALSYGWAKLVGEKMIEFAVTQGEHVRASVARIIGAYGPNQDYDLQTGSAIPALIRRAIEYPRRSPFQVMSTGEERRSYCFVKDVVDGIMRSASRSH